MSANLSSAKGSSKEKLTVIPSQQRVSHSELVLTPFMMNCCQSLGHRNENGHCFCWGELSEVPSIDGKNSHCVLPRNKIMDLPFSVCATEARAILAFYGQVTPQL